MADHSNTSPRLLQHSSKIFPTPIHAKLVACCPTMDLVATVSQDEQLNVYRFGGQRAFGLQRRKEGKAVISSIGWKADGQYLAVGWSDGIVEVVSAETGNVLQHFRQESLSGKASEASGGVSCIAWGLNFIDVKSVKTKIGADTASFHDFNGKGIKTSDNWNKSDYFATLDDFLERIPDSDKIEIPLDLPEQVARFDVTSSMPSLPALPLLPPAVYRIGNHPCSELFASQIALDAALNLKGLQNGNGFEALLLAQNGGVIRLILYDSLSIGEITFPVQWNVSAAEFRDCAFHPFSSTYMFLAHIAISGGPPQTALIPVSLHFMRSSGSQLHMIESKTAQLETLVQYVGECLLAIHHHWKHANELPTRFMDNINETLLEKQERQLRQLLFHLAATGDCPPMLKEWLVDILGERGHKRWDHSITHGYSKVLELTHENLLPALDRCAALISSVRGFAIYYQNSRVFDVPEAEFNTVLEIIRCLRTLAHQILIFSSEELQQFNVFSKWLRKEIDVHASESSLATEDNAQEPTVDYTLLLAYIQGPMEGSKLGPMIKLEADTPFLVAQPNLYHELKVSLNEYRSAGDCNTDVINLGCYYDEWARCNRRLVDKITNHQRSRTQLAGGIIIGNGEVVAQDIRMVFEGGGDDTITTFTAIVEHDVKNQVNFTRIVHSSDYDDASSVHSLKTVSIRLPGGLQIRDLKFVDDEDIMLLVLGAKASHLLKLTYRGADPTVVIEGSPSAGLDASLLPKGQPLSVSNTVVHLSATALKACIKHSFRVDEDIKPMRIEINGRQKRRFVAVVGQDVRQMKILDLDFKEGSDVPKEQARKSKGDPMED